MAAKHARPQRIEPRLGTAAPVLRAEPRGAKAPRRPRAPRRGLLSRCLRGAVYWGTIIGLWGGIAAGGLILFYGMQLPSVSTWKVPERPPNVQIVALGGEVLGNRGKTGGEAVRLEQLPDYVAQAVIAIEDRRFESHFGVDPLGLGRAVATNLVAGRLVQGGSTLTQQLAKNMFLSPERSFRRKVQEVVLALWLEARFSKGEILEMYLNRVYFGAGAYGIDAAARRYFGKPATHLRVHEAAVLAGLLRAPSTYAPNRNPKGARARAALVIEAMRQEGFLSAEEAEAALGTRLAVNPRETAAAGYVADWVMDQLPAHVGAIDGDIVVETTIDIGLQREAEAALSAALAESGKELRAGQGALVALDGTGAVRALVGGRSYAASQYNRAVVARRQPGSAFKPFVFLAALERGLSPGSIRRDEPVRIGKWSPKNYTEDYLGPVTLTTALSLSINTVAATLAAEVGPKAVIRTARRLGIASPLQANASIALGTSEVTLLELTGAYASFANGGYGAAPFVIKRIREADGDFLYERPPPAQERAIDAGTVAEMNMMLATTLERGTGRKAQIAGWPAAGKTGTTQDFRDAWFVGYTANLTTGVWVGNDSNKPMKKVTGGGLPALVWRAFMTAAHEGVPVAGLPGVHAEPVTEAPAIEAAHRTDAPAEGEPASGERTMMDLILGR